MLENGKTTTKERGTLVYGIEEQMGTDICTIVSEILRSADCHVNFINGWVRVAQW